MTDTPASRVLLDDISAFLDRGFVDDGGQGGYALATDQDKRDLRDIIDRLIDLKFQRDEDNDQGVRIFVEDRRVEHLAYAVVPRPPEREIDPESAEFLSWQRDVLSSAGLLSFEATTAIRRVQSEIEQRLIVALDERKVLAMIEKLFGHAAAGEVAFAEDAIETLVGKNGAVGLMAADDDRQEMIRQVRLELYPLEVIRETEALDSALRALADAPIGDRAVEGNTWEVLNRVRQRFGRDPFADQATQFNRISRKRREERSAPAG